MAALAVMSKIYDHDLYNEITAAVGYAPKKLPDHVNKAMQQWHGDVSWLDSSGNAATGTTPTWPNASQGPLNMLKACPNDPHDLYL